MQRPSSQSVQTLTDEEKRDLKNSLSEIVDSGKILSVETQSHPKQVLSGRTVGYEDSGRRTTIIEWIA